MYRSININGSAAPGYSSGQAMEAMAELAEEVLPADKSYGFEWSGMSYQEKLAGNTKIFVFTFAVLVVYLVLAAQYESWILPLMILIPVPLVMLGALLAQNLRDSTTISLLRSALSCSSAFFEKRNPHC